MATWPSAAWAEPAPAIEPAPAWVRQQPVPPPNPGKKEQPLQLLLSTIQHRIGSGSNEIYVRTVAVPQTTTGLQALGNVTIPWNSERAGLAVHHVLLRRGQETIDVLKGQELVVLRRENNLENSVLDGIRTMVLQVPGLQVGDQIDIAFTQKLRPIPLVAKPESIMAIIEGSPIAMLDRRLLVTDGVKVQWRADPSLGVQTKKKATETEFSYVRQNYEPAKVPANAPIRYQIPTMQLTTYEGWKDVAAVMKPLFDKARAPDAGSLLPGLADEIAKAHSTPEARMLAALRVAQERVRYVALALGEGAYVPATADQTWARKFGDCKGKTAMLLALLDNLGISAEAMLTSSEASSVLGDRLPSLDAFNHVVVRAHVGGRDYVLDATGYGQRTLSELQLPIIDWGLPLVDGAELWRVPKSPPPHPLTETEIVWDASNGFDQHVPFTVTLTYRDKMASLMRLLQTSVPDRQSLEKYLKAQVPRIEDELLQVEAVDSDVKDGAFVARLKGTAPMDWDRRVGGRKYYFDHSIPTWKPNFERDAGPWKDLPVELVSPSWMRGSETVILPLGGQGFALKAEPISSTVAGTEIKRSGKINAGRATVVAEFRRLAEEIPAQEARTARATLDRIAKDYAYATAPKDYVVSRAEVKAIISKDAEGYDEYVERARLLMDQDDRTRAIGELDKAIKVDATRADAPALRAINYFFLNRQKDGRPDVAKALSLDSDDSDTLRAQALYAWYDRNSELALKSVNRAIQLEPNFHGLYSIRAGIRAGLGQYDDALVDVRRAVELSADTMSPGRIAQYEAASGRFDQALVTLEGAIASKAMDEPYLYVLKGDFLFLQGRKDEAAASYRTAREAMRAHLAKQFEKVAGDASPQSDIELNLLVASRNYVEAEQVADQKIARQRYPSASNLAKRAWLRSMNGKYEGAVRDARSALELDPSDPIAQASLILAYLRSGKFREAEAQATKALAATPANAHHYYARAIARKGLGNEAGAGEDLKTARQLQFDIILDPAFFGLKAN